MTDPNTPSTAPLENGVRAPAEPARLPATASVNPAILDAAARYYGRVIADGGLPALAQISPQLGEILKRAGG